MADTRVKIMDLTAGTPVDADYIPFVDVSDTTQSADGTTKRALKSDLEGTNGEDGNGIASVTLTSTVGLVKTYTITFTDATTTTFDVTDGEDGTDGTDGTDGKTILNGTVAPTTEGEDGDFYINTATNIIYGPKSGTWGAGTPLAGGSNTTIYNIYKAPQIFNPDALEVTAGIAVFTLSGASEIGLVTINGQTLDDSEYSLTGSDITVTPDNGFYSITDEVLVFQSKVTATGFDLGWGYYQDSTYTVGSPLAINNSRVQLTIDGLGTNTETGYLPSSGDLWDSNEITPNEVGDSLVVRLDFRVKASKNNTFFELQLDIGDGSSIVIYSNTLSIVKGINTEQRFSLSMPLFALSTFITNGGKLYIDSTADTVNLSIYELGITIIKTK